MKQVSRIFILMMILSTFANISYSAEIIQLNKWRFKTGDNLEWAKSDYNDASWDNLVAGKGWEEQGYPSYDGYGWYRIKFLLPLELKNNAMYQDSLMIDLGKVDDTDETYLNGSIIGKNGRLVTESDTVKFESDKDGFFRTRKYILSVNDPKIHWGKENIIAIRVFDQKGGGGLYIANMFVTMRDLKDYLVIDDMIMKSKLENRKYSKAVMVSNVSGFSSLSGQFVVNVVDKNTDKQQMTKTWDILLEPGKKDSFAYEFDLIENSHLFVTYTFEESKSKHKVTQSFDMPFILTPPMAETPKINGAKVFATRPGSPFIFRIPATGIRPMTYDAKMLPKGLTLDTNTGVITGIVKDSGTYIVKLTAKNNKGEYSRNLKIVIGSQIILTPPMGWNSWNVWGLSVDNDKVCAAADAFEKTGLADHGWRYINIDDGWEAPERTKNGEIVCNQKFPDMKATSDYVHSKGLKFGIYSSPGPLTCGGYLGSYQHELQDVQSYAKWGVDYLKYDWCSYFDVCKNAQDIEELKKPYKLLSECLSKQKRDIVHSICQYGMGSVWEWGGSVGGDLWRTNADIVDSWKSMSSIGFVQDVPASHSKSGNFNDPDMLVVGWVGWGPKLHSTRLTASEQYTHISLWALLSAPLLIGCDLTRLDDFTLSLLTNDEVLDIDQDHLVISALPVVKRQDYQIWVKTLEDGNIAVGLFNLTPNELSITATWEELGIKGKQIIRDLWRQKDIGNFENKFETNVLPHGVVLLKIIK